MANTATNCYVLFHRRPRIGAMWFNPTQTVEWRDEECYFLVFVPDASPAERIARWYFDMTRSHRRTHLHILCNDYRTWLGLSDLKVPCTLCSQNCTVDERLFVPQSLPKQYDAIYVGRAQPYKRLELASALRNRVGFLTYNDDLTYLGRLWAVFPLQSWLNYNARRQYRYLPPPEMAKAISTAHVGLCLSAREGAMWASMEYLLCGVPVVTTRNVGGRDLFFESEFTEWVEDDPQAVAAAVERLKRRQIDPKFIRRVTFQKLLEHRGRFLARLQECFDAAAVQEDARRIWAENFKRNLVRWGPWHAIWS